jgi:DNA polymerase-4
MSNDRLILHVDADAFFASVEQALRPELKGSAVIVGGSDRGVVSAASYEARRYGVHSAMPMVQARKLCPHAVFVNPNFQAYSEFSARMFHIMKRFSPLVEATSVDEGYVDLTGTLRLHRAPPWEVAHRLLREIRSTLDINVSGGMARTRTWAKMATGLAKPNGLLYLDPERAQTILGALSVSSIPGVGEKGQKILEHAGISTVADLVAADRDSLSRLLGRWGEQLVNIASGDNCRPIVAERQDSQKSYSKERTLERDTRDYLFIRSVARELGEKLAIRLRADGKGAATVTLKIRYADFTDYSRSISLTEPTNLSNELLNCIDRLLRKTILRNTKIRQVGVKLSGIGPPVLQMDLFDPKRPLFSLADRAVDTIRQRFGFGSVQVSGWS